MWEAIGSGASRDHIFTAILEELERTPTLLVFEDVHWADEATLDVIKFLGRRIQRTHSVLALSYRDEEVDSDHPLRSAIGDLPRANVRRMILAPLSQLAVGQLASRAGRSPVGLYNITAGNPLFLTEVLAAGADIIPATVRDAVLARAARLSPRSREIAELVCVVPARTGSWLLNQAVHADATGIAGCLRMGMVLSADGSLGFRHELVRRALEESLPLPRRMELNDTVLAILVSRSGVSAARLAHHASGARDRDAVMRFAALAATQAAAVGAHRQAAAHYETMLEYAGELAPAERVRLLEPLAFECHLIARYAPASAACCEALQIWRALGARLQEGATLGWLSRLTWWDGGRVEAHQYCAEAIAVLESLPAGLELAQVYCYRADLDMKSHECESAIEFARRSIVLAQKFSSNRILSDALTVLGIARLIVDDPSGWNDLEHSLELAMAGGFQMEAASAYNALSAMAVSRRQYREAAHYLRAGLAYCEERDLDLLRPYMLAYRARMNFERGQWLEASEDAEAALHDPRASSVARIPALRILGHLRIRRGDPKPSGPLDEARQLAGAEPELQRLGTLAAIRAEAAWLAGDYEVVIREVTPAYERVSQRPDPRMKGELAVWLWRADALEGVPAQIAEPYAMEITGNWRDAAAAWQAFGCPYEQALLLSLYGGESEQREALALFTLLGAAPATDLLRRRMRARGIRAIPRGAHSSTQQNSYGLTRREAQVLVMLRDGLANAAIAKGLFLSTRTVDHHVSAILAKLGATSRTQAIEIARRQSETEN